MGAMEYRKLGRAGLKVSELCLGTMTFLWTADEPTCFDILSAFVGAGGNFVDTADIYSRWAPGNPGGTAEMVIGNWIKRGGSPRDRLVIATKGRGPMGDGPNDAGASRAHLVPAVEASLRRLQTDYIDLYQIHWWDAETPAEETLRALDDLVSSGKVRYIGASNIPAWALMKSLWVSDVRRYVRFECLQPHYNLMHRAEFEGELMPVCQDQGLGVIPYSPLAGGFLTGKYLPGQAAPAGARGENNDRIRQYAESERGQKVLNALSEIGRARGKSVSQTALAWLLSNPIITAPIVGANSVAQLAESLGAAGYRLSASEVAALEESKVESR
jgi:aryl-alcohol dehydrogenase-like predicted oxidoreductase